MKEFIQKVLALQPSDRQRKGLLPLEWSLMAYVGLTLILMAVMSSHLVEPMQMLGTRALVVSVTLILWALYRKFPCSFLVYVRVCMPFIFLSRLYPDTYEFCRIFDNLDHVFATLEQSIFGCQPSLWFSIKCPWKWFSEALNLGYSSYFFMLLVTVTWFWIKNPRDLQRLGFVVLSSFFLYYLVYIFLPVSGPQYYYQAEGVDPYNGVFPAMGHYFNTHTEMYPAPVGEGVFYDLVWVAHVAGERPTAAFPSSHIGISTILIFMVFRYRQRGLGFFLLPFYLLLCVSTVYIHAHYLIDAIAGFVTAWAVYFFLESLYNRIPWKEK